jgi:sugar-specific transcriptional regulator TrmB
MAASDLLVPFGFTNLESEIYLFLLGESPATGYRVAQAIGKPAANTYKAIQTLQTKGAVLVEQGTNRLCRAVAAEELLARLQREFEQQKAAAQRALESVAKPQDDDRIYSLRSREQTLGRARVMLGGAKSQILLKCAADVLEELRPNLEEAIERGIDVAMLTSALVAVGNDETAADPNVTVEFSVVTDGDQAIAGALQDGSAECVWTRSRFLVQTIHAGLAAEICLTQVARQLHDDEKKSRIVRTLDSQRRLP